MARLSLSRLAWLLLVSLFTAATLAAPARAQQLPELTAPVNDFAHVVDAQSAATLETLIRSLQQASGDVVVVATVESIAPYADAAEFAVRMFENRGRGIGTRGNDNGLLVLLAVKERQVRIEVGYGLEGIITDGFSGQTSREFMVPSFRQGAYGEGLVSGVSRIVARIADARGVTLQGLRRPAAHDTGDAGNGRGLLIALLLLIFVLNAIGSSRRRRFGRRWGGGPWSGWHSGVGPFGGGFGGGFGGFGGGGGGFGGFGGGRSGGGGGGGSW